MDNTILPEEKSICCAFCHKGRHQVEHMIQGPSVNGSFIYICDECIDVSHAILQNESEQEISVDEKIKKKKGKPPTPEKIKAHLDEYIIGQDDAKIAISVAIYNHYKRIHSKSTVEIEKSNLLMVGESGCGKTLTVKTIAKLLDLPFIIADATSLTEAGYVGEDVENLITRLLQSADGDIEQARHGIIFIDEIDKKSRKSESSSVARDVSGEGVQQSLLKLIEGSVVKVENDFGEEIEFDTKDILFVFSGAFVGLDTIVSKSRAKTSIGIGATLAKKESFSSIAKDVLPSDFVKFGLIPEFVGRCPVTVVFDDLTSDIMVRILKEPKNSIVSQFKALFKFDGVDLDFDDKYLQNVAAECLTQKIGARGLRSVMEKNLRSVQYMLPRKANEGVNKVYIDSTGAATYIYKEVKQKVNKRE